MLFVIDSSIGKMLENESKPNDDVISAIEHIARARREGKHLVFAERKTMNALRKCSLLSDLARRVYNRIYQRLPQQGIYLKTLVRRVEVVAAEGVLEVVTQGQCQVIRVSASYFRDFSLVDETIFLCENIKDVAFYKKMAGAYLAESVGGRIVIRCEPRGGGGQTTADQYQSIQSRKNRFCLCILDSDKEAPNAKLGGTVKAVRKVDDPKQCLCEWAHLNVREIENLIPTQMYRTALTANDPLMKTIELLEQLEASSVPDSRRYLELKKGIKLGRVRLAPTDTQFYKYWTPTLSAIASELPSISDDCWQTTGHCTNKKDCKCIVMPGLGPKILDTVIKKVIIPKSNDEIAQMVCPSLKAEWIRLGEMITAWCCGSSRLSAL